MYFFVTCRTLSLARRATCHYARQEHSRYKYERLNPTIQRIESSLFQPATNGPADTQEVTSDRVGVVR